MAHKTYCDFCGEEIKPENSLPIKEWDSLNYSYIDKNGKCNDVILKLNLGVIVKGDFGNRDEEKDICIKCFKNIIDSV